MFLKSISFHESGTWELKNACESIQGGMMMKNRLAQIREKAISQITGCDTAEKLNEVRVAILGKKGELTD